ncbi:MAG: chitobiase/beta-hexosaminidase C-terminal domain-containing protein [Lentisphaeria bacterium]|nr:chitobiase/beta-hexosaminidase C-terminal domain-containing protein [Lentisphaeria bacterium]
MKKSIHATKYILAVALCILAMVVYGDTVKEADLKNILDVASSKSITIKGNCTNANSKKSYSSDNIVNENGSKTPVAPSWGTTFLEMAGKTGYVTTEARSGRLYSTFTFEVAGARTVNFDYRAALYGGNDDALIFYEDDPEDTLFEAYGEYWGKKYKEDGELYWDLEYTDFWNTESIDLEPTSYFHTVHVAVLTPYAESKEYYDDPAETKVDNEIEQKVWLDNLYAEPSDYSVCLFSEEDGATFGANGMYVYIDTDYLDSSAMPVLTYYYTLDGSSPASSSTRRRYSDAEGIEIKKTCTLRVAAFEGTRLISDAYKASYSQREAPQSPTCTAGVQTPFDDTGLEIVFSATGAAPNLKFRYTLDGSDPTGDSMEGDSVVVSSPCTLKVVTYDDGTLSAVSQFNVVRCDAPAYSCICDGFESEECFFCNSASIALRVQTDASVYYRINGGVVAPYTSKLNFSTNALLEAQACVASNDGVIASGGSILLNSSIVSVNARKSGTCGPEWIEEQLSGAPGWKLFGVFFDIPQKHSAELAMWLKPYGYNPSRKSYELSEKMETGHAYWIYVGENGIPAAGRPAVFYAMERENEPKRPSGWNFIDAGASFHFDGMLFYPVNTQKELPGWRKF